MPTPDPGAPRARQDPIRCADDALAIVMLAMSSPPRHEVIAYFVDDDGCGRGVITCVRDTVDPDAVIGVAEVMGLQAAWVRDAAGPSPAGLVLASVRPGEGVTADDLFRWCRVSDVLEDLGVVLLEWFVIGRDGVCCPRDLTGEPDRWLAA